MGSEVLPLTLPEGPYFQRLIMEGVCGLCVRGLLFRLPMVDYVNQHVDLQEVRISPNAWRCYTFVPTASQCEAI